MKLYLLTQNVNNRYDTYDSCVVCSENEEDARTINPGGLWDKTPNTRAKKPEDVEVNYIGEAKDGMVRGIILASFSA